MSADEISYLRYYIAHLVRIWTALSILRKERSSELISVCKDLCSDKLRNMLYELAHKRPWTLGFLRAGTPKHQRLYKKLEEANKWFQGNRLHYRNCSGSHMQPLDKADHMFQVFGYGGEREWKHLTKGVAACVAMMKLIDGNHNQDFWRKVRLKVAGVVNDTISADLSGNHLRLDIPIGVEALLKSYKVEDPD